MHGTFGAMRAAPLLLAFFVAQVLAACAWKGSYAGTLQGVPVVLLLDCSEGVYTGRMEAEGYPYTIRLTPTAPTIATGTFSDPQLGGVLSCSAIWKEGTLELHIGEEEATAGVTPLRLVFQRTSAALPAPAPPVAEGARDARLIGTWTYSQSYVSGSYSFATEWRLTLMADGTLRQAGRTVGGGPDVSGDSGEGEVSTGRWRTRDGHLELDTGAGFAPHARYVCDGARVMFTLANGDKQVWVRE